MSGSAITLGSVVPNILRVYATRRISFFIPAVLDNEPRSIFLNIGQTADLNTNEVLTLGNTLQNLLTKGYITIQSIGQTLDATDVSYEPGDPSFFGGENSIAASVALDIIVAAIGGSSAPIWTVQDTDYVIPTTMYGGTVYMDTTVGPLTATLPTAVGHGGQTITVVNIGSGSNNLTLAAPGGQTIIGQASVFYAPPQARTASSTNVNWVLV